MATLRRALTRAGAGQPGREGGGGAPDRSGERPLRPLPPAEGANAAGRRRSRFGRAFPGFSVRPTRAFWVYLAAVPVLGVAALNTGNNALYLLLALTLGTLVAGGWVSRHTLRHLSVRVVAPAEAFCGAPVALEVQVRNASRLVPAAGVVCRLVGMPGATLVPTIAPRSEVRTRVTTAFARRGRHPLPAVRVEVRLPLPFFVKSTTHGQDGDLLVFPRRLAAGPPRWAGISLHELEASSGSQRRHGEVDQLREFRPGDDRRDIHWKQTARQQRPIVMERRERAAPSRFLVLDRQLPRRDDAEILERFEDLISEVASTAVAQLRRGEAVGLVIGGAITPPATGSRHVRRLLERLALIQAVGPGEDPLPPGIGAGPTYRLVEGR